MTPSLPRWFTLRGGRRPEPVAEPLAELLAEPAGEPAAEPVAEPVVAPGSGRTRRDLRVLLLAGADDDPTTRAWRATLERTGTEHDVLRPGADSPLRAQDLVREDDPDHGRYHAVVVGTDTSTFWTSLPVLADYRRRFGVRQLAAFEFPRPEAGLDDAEGRSTGGSLARVTAAGAETFGYLRGRFRLSPGSYGYRADVVAPDRFTTLVQTEDGDPVVGVVEHGDGRQDCVVLVNHDEWMLHGLLLARGLLAWVTGGVHCGLDRYRLACHVDDVLLANALTREENGTVPSGPALVRMDPQDVDALLDWQSTRGFVLDLAYNGFGAAPEDPLTLALLRHADRFRWINHTWSHLDLDPMAEPELHEEITANQRWATSVDLPTSTTALVTGVHSGLANPALPAVLHAAGITAIAEDASLPTHGACIGPATTVPRHPTNIYTHVSRWADLLADYNRQYAAQGVHAATVEDFVDAEAAIVLRHVLTNDPRPLFAHQSNLAQDRILLTFLGHVLDLLREHLADGVEVVNESMDDLARELHRRARWQHARCARQVSAVLSGDVLELSTTSEVEVPLTVPVGSHCTDRAEPVGTSYAGSCSGWIALRAGQVLQITLPPARTA
ncbi:Agd3-related carbohydrate deacetylase [Kineococcus sp. SYSU DK003]|uniref:Agd3-related carbohydrate deacetylase n=1 Tax=Kineococcus sp. SYSU DK003 TaxID=3383124 RepID=UPI003D7EE88A